MSGDEHRGGGPRAGSVAIMVVLTVVIAVLGMNVMDAASGDVGPYLEKSEEWCDERDGELYNANVIGEHGGLHCELPNGTSVHMWEVVDVEESERP